MNLRLAFSVLMEGGTIAHATETCYGFACDMTNREAVERLFTMKRRPPDQPISALFASLDQAKEYVEWNDTAEELASEYLPGPLTIVLPIREEKLGTIFPKPNPRTNRFAMVRGKPHPNPTIGIRLSSHPLAQALVASFGRPLTTTSANVHGRPSPFSAEEIVEQFINLKAKPALVLDSGQLQITEASTVIDCTDGMRILREGALEISL